VRNIAGADASLHLLRLDGLDLLRTRAGGAWAAHAHDHGDAAHGHDEHGHDDHGHDDHGHDEHGHDEHGHDGHGHDDSETHAHADHETGAPVQGIPDDEVDPHVWLDPDNAQAIVRAVADRLAALDPAHAGTYRDNADAAVRRIAEMDAELAERVAPVADRPFVVFHDAYHYFEDHYGLNAVGSITLSPDRQPGARRLAEIRGKIAELDARCVFREPQFAPDLVDTVVENTAAEIGTLDPLGVAQPAGPDAYFTTMRDLAETLTDCLLPES
jgi:zinc transport system substrate-binding protein